MARAATRLLVVAAAVAMSGPATALEASSKGVSILHPWARATPGAAKVGAAFLEIKAEVGVSDRLIGVRTDTAGTVELHTHIMDGGIARMRRIEAIDVPPGGSVILKPGGLHLMLIDLARPLKQGDLLKLTLIFENAGQIEIEAGVEMLGAMGPRGFDQRPGQPPAAEAGPGHGGHTRH